MALTKKQLINVSEHHKSWIESVVRAAEATGQETNQTDIIRALLDQAMVQDPETFVTHLGKMKLKARIDDIQRRKAAIEAEEEKLVSELQTTEGRASTATR